ncbi:MAG TPA: hypothetical protein VL135_13315 [Terracidiphilus sp.]|nr:hypothetical protein [Terracidiphilus sp.]
MARTVLTAMLFAALNVLMSSCGSLTDNSLEDSVISPCILTSNPSRYDNQRVKLTGHITSTKDGAYIWSDDCKDRGVTLLFGDALQHDVNLHEALLRYGMSQSPLKATLVGRFRNVRSGGVRALIFGNKTFEAEQILDLQVPSTQSATDR